MKKILIRSASGAVYVALIVAALYIGKWTGEPLVGNLLRYLLFGFVLFVGLFECLRCIELSGTKVNKPLGYVLAAAVWLCCSCISFDIISDIASLVFLFIVFVLAVPVAFIWQLWRHDEQPFASAAASITGVIYLALPTTLMLLLPLIREQRYANILMMIFILTWVNDTGAYLSGMALGRHKLWPRHSPGKTIEGSVGGLLFCVATALFVGPLFDVPFTRIAWLGLALIVAVFGTLGDLVESMLKRSAGLKDSGNIMPGHGGILDRFDSILLIVPIAYLYLFIIE